MKRTIFSFAACLVALVSGAQDDSGWTAVTSRDNSVATNSFFSNWFISATVAGTVFHADNEPEVLSDSPFKSFRNNVNLSFAVGKWFTPGMGLRTKVSGFWGKNVVSDNADANVIKYLTLQENLLFNLSNILYGYNPQRTYNMIPYLGFGFMRNISHNHNSMCYSFGLLNSFRLSDRVALVIDVNYNRSQKTSLTLVPLSAYALEVGITYNIGKAKWKKTPDVEAIHEMYQMEIDAINAQLEDERTENDSLRQQLSPE